MAELELARQAKWGGGSSEEADGNLLALSPDPVSFPMAETGDIGAKAARGGKDSRKSFLPSLGNDQHLSSSIPVEGNGYELLDQALPSGRLGLRTQEEGRVPKGERFLPAHRSGRA